MADVPPTLTWIPPYMRERRPAVLLPSFRNDAPTYEPGDRIILTDRLKGMMVQSRHGTIAGPHLSWRGYYVVRMDAPVLLLGSYGTHEALPEIWLTGDRMRHDD